MNLLFPAVVLAATAGFLLLSHQPTTTQTPIPAPGPTPPRPPSTNPNVSLMDAYNKIMAEAGATPNLMDLNAMQDLQNQLDAAGLTTQSVQLGAKISEIKIMRATGQATAGWVGPTTGSWGHRRFR